MAAQWAAEDMYMQEAEMEYFVARAAVIAHQQLIALNAQSWKPEVSEWLHSPDAAPVLAQLLVNVPCSDTLN
jgi:hypothetical protein